MAKDKPRLYNPQKRMPSKTTIKVALYIIWGWFIVWTLGLLSLGVSNNG